MYPAGVAQVVALIRHGNYEQPEGVPSALLPHPLTSGGREQAVACAELLRDFAKAHELRIAGTIYCSPLLRAYETARLLGHALEKDLVGELALHQDARLCERSLGAAANLTVGQIEAILERDPRYGVPAKGWKARSRYRLPFVGAESLQEAGQRVAEAIGDGVKSLMHEGHAPNLRLVVGHGASFRHAAASLGVLEEAEIPKLSMFHCKPVLLRKTAGRFHHLDGEWKIRAEHEGPD